MASTSEYSEAIEYDAIDQISQKLAIVLLKNQRVSFERLREATLLPTKSANYNSFIEIIVLSIIKFLGLESEFKSEIKSDTEAYRMFNALNLNDDSVNMMFCKFIAVIAPEIYSALSAILAELTARLASASETRYTSERLGLLQNFINEHIETSVDAPSIDHDRERITSKSKTKRARKHKRMSFSENFIRLAAGVSVIEPTKKKSSSKESSKSPSAESKKSSLITTKKLRFRDQAKFSDETAEETAERLSKLKLKESKVIPDSKINPLPNKEEIRKVKPIRVEDSDDDFFV